MLFLYYVILKPIGLSSILNTSYTCTIDFVTSYICCIGLLSYIDFSNVDIIYKVKKSHSFISPQITNVCKFGDTFMFTMVNIVFQNKFPLGNLILLFATNIGSCFSELMDSHHSFLGEKKKRKIPNTCVCRHNFSPVVL